MKWFKKDVEEDFVLVSHTVIKEELKSAASSEMQRLESILNKNSIITTEDFNLLKDLGFSTPDVREVTRQKQIKSSAKDTLQTLTKLEGQGFIVITSDFLETHILEKYNLVCGPAKAFMKNIPAENVKELAEVVKNYKEKRFVQLSTSPSSHREIEVYVVSPIFDFNTTDYNIKNGYVIEIPKGDPIIFIRDFYCPSLYIYATGWDVEKDIFLKEFKEFKQARKKAKRTSIYDDMIF